MIRSRYLLYAGGGNRGAYTGGGGGSDILAAARASVITRAVLTHDVAQVPVPPPALDEWVTAVQQAASTLLGGRVSGDAAARSLLVPTSAAAHVVLRGGFGCGGVVHTAQSVAAFASAGQLHVACTPEDMELYDATARGLTTAVHGLIGGNDGGLFTAEQAGRDVYVAMLVGSGSMENEAAARAHAREHAVDLPDTAVVDEETGAATVARTLDAFAADGRVVSIVSLRQ